MLAVARTIADWQLKRRTRCAVIAWHKTGNTWLSAMLRFAIMKHFALSEEMMGRVFITDVGGRDAFALPDYVRIAHTHALPHALESGLIGTEEMVRRFDDKPVLILMRDFRDLIVSSYMHEVYRATNSRFDGNADAFARSAVFGAERIASYYRLIADLRRQQSAQTRLLSYEDLWRAPEKHLAEVWSFLGYPEDAEAITFAVKSASIENMRRMELEATQETSKVPGLFRSANDGENAMKVRRGGTGGWTEHLSQETGDWLVALHDDTKRYVEAACNPHS
jgi:hypothetical protein